MLEVYHIDPPKPKMIPELKKRYTCDSLIVLIQGPIDILKSRIIVFLLGQSSSKLTGQLKRRVELCPILTTETTSNAFVDPRIRAGVHGRAVSWQRSTSATLSRLSKITLTFQMVTNTHVWRKVRVHGKTGNWVRYQLTMHNSDHAPARVRTYSLQSAYITDNSQQRICCSVFNVMSYDL